MALWIKVLGAQASDLSLISPMCGGLTRNVPYRLLDLNVRSSGNGST